MKNFWFKEIKDPKGADSYINVETGMRLCATWAHKGMEYVPQVICKSINSDSNFSVVNEGFHPMSLDVVLVEANKMLERMMKDLQ